MTGLVRAGPLHTAAMAAIHAAAFPPRDAWGPDALALQLALPGVFGLIDPAGGMVLARVAADEAEVLTLAVVPEQRRHGVATCLLAEAVKAIRELGGRTVFLEVAEGNAAARALYRRFGFIEAGRRPRYYSNSADALVLRMNLS